MGGNLIIGGIFYIFFKKFFNLSTDKFFKALIKYLYTDELFAEVFQKVNIVLFSNQTEEFAINGAKNKIAINNPYLNESEDKNFSEVQ